MIQVEFTGGTRSSRLWLNKEQAKGQRRATLSPLSWKGVGNPSGYVGREGSIPRCALSLVFRERKREIKSSPASCAVDNKRNARHNSQRERMGPSSCKVNKLHRTWICTIYSLATSYVHVQIRPARNFITVAQLQVRKIRMASSFRPIYFGCPVTRFDWMRFDKKYDRESLLTFTHYYVIDFRIDRIVHVNIWR